MVCLTGRHRRGFIQHDTTGSRHRPRREVYSVYSRLDSRVLSDRTVVCIKGSISIRFAFGLPFHLRFIALSRTGLRPGRRNPRPPPAVTAAPVRVSGEAWSTDRVISATFDFGRRSGRGDTVSGSGPGTPRARTGCGWPPVPAGRPGDARMCRMLRAHARCSCRLEQRRDGSHAAGNFCQAAPDSIRLA